MVMIYPADQDGAKPNKKSEKRLLMIEVGLYQPLVGWNMQDLYQFKDQECNGYGKNTIAESFDAGSFFRSVSSFFFLIYHFIDPGWILIVEAL